MLDQVLKNLFGRKESGPFCLPGAINDGARILAVATADLVDFLFHVPLLAGIRKRWPGASIDVLLPEPFAPLVVPSGVARQVLIYTEKQLNPWRPAYAALLRSLGKTGYDVALVMSVAPQPPLEGLALASGAPLRIGPSHKDNYPAINMELRRTEPASGYAGDLPQQLAPYLGLAPDDVPRGWPLPADKLRQMAQLVHFHKPNKEQLLVGMDPGLGMTGHGLAIDNLLYLARQVTGHVSCRVLPLTDAANQERLQKFEAQLANVPIGLKRDTMLETVLLLCQCDLFLAGNTSLFHVAVAQGVPTVGLFTSSDGERWLPQSPGHVQVLQVAKGEKVDVATLLAAIETVTEGRGARARNVTLVPASAAPATPPPAGA